MSRSAMFSRLAPCTWNSGNLLAKAPKNAGSYMSHNATVYFHYTLLSWPLLPKSSFSHRLHLFAKMTWRHRHDVVSLLTEVINDKLRSQNSKKLSFYKTWSTLKIQQKIKITLREGCRKKKRGGERGGTSSHYRQWFSRPHFILTSSSFILFKQIIDSKTSEQTSQTSLSLLFFRL